MHPTGPSLIIPTAEPFFFPGGPVGCLLVHGFTGSPKEMRWMGEYLNEQGYSVLGIRLAGHATRPPDLLRARWTDWLANLEDGWHLLSGACPRIYVMGLSMGGILALTFAARQTVAGAVAISTPYALSPDPRLPFAKAISLIMPEVPKGPPDWRNPEAAKDHVEYPRYPTRAFAELRDLLVEMRAALPRITAPVLLVHARHDSGSGGFDPESMTHIYDALQTPTKQMLWVENSGHVVTREPNRRQVFQAVHDFIEQAETQPMG